MVERIDFAALLAPVRFGQPVGKPDQAERGAEPPGKKAREGIVTMTAKHRMASMKAAEDMLTMIPDEGQSFHGILLTYCDLAHVLTALLTRLDVHCSEMRIATLSLSARNVAEMAGWLDSGKVKTLDVLVSHFFAKNNESIHQELLSEMAKRNQRVAVARSHAKIVTMSMADGRRFVVLTSANLRSNRNLEVLSLTCDQGLHAWFDAWINDMVVTHGVQETEVNTSHDQQAG